MQIIPDEDPVSIPSAPTMRGGDPATLGRVDHYDLLCKLGGGGFGVVYLARDTASGLEVALKTLHPLLKRDDEAMTALREKFSLVARLAHPNIATALVLHPVRDVNVWDDDARRELKLSPGDSVMVMRYAPGVTLSKWRRQFEGGVVPLDRVLEIGRQVAAALDYAHGERIVHRDIKPSNIMVETREDGRLAVRLLDFGLAAEIRSSLSRVTNERGDTSGTRPYMAPEQWTGRPQDGRTDQYALACLLYELLSGAPPFAGVFETGDPVVMRETVLRDDPYAVESVPDCVNEAFAWALAKEKEQRFPTCTVFVDALAGDVRSAPPPQARALQAAPAPVPAPMSRSDAASQDPALEASILARRLGLAREVAAIPSADRTDPELAARAAQADSAMSVAEDAIKFGRFAAAGFALDQARAELDAIRDRKADRERLAREAEEARRAAETAAKKKAAEEAAARKKAAEEARRKAAEEAAARKKAAEEARRKAAEAAAAKKKAERDERRRKKEEASAAQRAAEAERKARREAARREREEAERRAKAAAAEESKRIEEELKKARTARRSAERSRREAARAETGRNRPFVGWAFALLAVGVAFAAVRAFRTSEESAGTPAMPADELMEAAESGEDPATTATGYVSETELSFEDLPTEIEQCINAGESVKYMGKAAAERKDKEGFVQDESKTPAVLSNGIYTNAIDGVDWTFTIENGQVFVGHPLPEKRNEGNGNFLQGFFDTLAETGTAVPRETTGDISVPSRFLGVPVTRIQSAAFLGCTNLTSITIPEGVTFVGWAAFMSCTNLTTISVPASVDSVAKFAFLDCRNLKHVIVSGNCSRGTTNLVDMLPKSTVVYVPRESSGWNVDIPGTWRGRSIRYLDEDPVPEPVHVEKSIDLGNGVKLEMVHCPGVEPDFWMGKYEVTQEQWECVMGSNPSTFKGAKNPVEMVRWGDSTNFVARLNALSAAKSCGLVFRLPTEEEWKVACRAAAPKSEKYCKLTDGTQITEKTLGRVAWFKDNSNGKTHPVGQKDPNAFGLYDMHGNVYEWTQNETRPGKHIRIGGSHSENAGNCGTYWISTPWGRAYASIGFRLAADARDAAAGLIQSDTTARPSDGEQSAASEAASRSEKGEPTAHGLFVSYYDLEDSSLPYDAWRRSLDSMFGFFKQRKPALSARTDDLGEFLDFGATWETGASTSTCRFHGKYSQHNTERFAMLATGTINVPATGSYRFGVLSDDGVALYVGDLLVVGSQTTRNFENGMLSGTISLPEGRHDFALAYHEKGGGQGLQVFWQPPSALKLVPLPQSVLAPTAPSFVSAAQEWRPGLAAAKESPVGRISGQGMVKTIDLGGGVKLEMVHCPGVAPDFWMGKYEVTQEQWERVMGNNPSRFKGAKNPVESVSWYECQEFVKKLNERPATKEVGLVIRLPTENEWLASCRAGAESTSTPGRYKLTDGTEITASKLSRVAVCERGWDDGPANVGSKEPNAWGLYDMHGNVWELTKTERGRHRVARGGYWREAAFHPFKVFPSSSNKEVGFRLAATGKASSN